MNNNDIKETALYLVLAVFVSVVVTFLLYANAYAENPHHPIPEPVVNITNVTEAVNNYAYIQDEVKLNDLEKHINALTALSSIPSLSSGTTGLGVGFGSSSGALALEHRNGVMSYRLGIGHSQGEEVVQFGVMGAFR